MWLFKAFSLGNFQLPYIQDQLIVLNWNLRDSGWLLPIQVAKGYSSCERWCEKWPSLRIFKLFLSITHTPKSIHVVSVHLNTLAQSGHNCETSTRASSGTWPTQSVRHAPPQPRLPLGLKDNLYPDSHLRRLVTPVFASHKQHHTACILLCLDSFTWCCVHELHQPVPLWTFSYSSLSARVYMFLLGCVPGRRRHIGPTLEGILIYQSVERLYTPTSKQGAFQLLLVHINSWCWHFGHPGGWWWFLMVALICSSLMTSEVEHLYMFLFSTCTSFLVKKPQVFFIIYL